MKPFMTVAGVNCFKKLIPVDVAYLLDMLAPLAPIHPSLFLSSSGVPFLVH
jgi:hypothetical protein